MVFSVARIIMSVCVLLGIYSKLPDEQHIKRSGKDTSLVPHVASPHLHLSESYKQPNNEQSIALPHRPFTPKESMKSDEHSSDGVHFGLPRKTSFNSLESVASQHQPSALSSNQCDFDEPLKDQKSVAGLLERVRSTLEVKMLSDKTGQAPKGCSVAREQAFTSGHEDKVDQSSIHIEHADMAKSYNQYSSVQETVNNDAVPKKEKTTCTSFDFWPFNK